MIARPWHPQAREMHHRGLTPAVIAEQLGLAVRTVQRFFDEKKRAANVESSRKARLKRRRKMKKTVRAADAERQRRSRQRRRAMQMGGVFE